MVPILYSKIIEGTVPSTFGIGPLTDTIEAKVTEERNGSCELELTYAAQGIHAEEIIADRYIMAKPNFTDDPQIFRIYKVGKSMNGRFTVNAQHISYDLSGKVIIDGSALNIGAACALLQGNAGAYTIGTDKTGDGAFKIDAPTSVRSWFGGKKGSLLDVYGSGEWHYNNFSCFLYKNRGTDRGVVIRYGKNLTELSQEIDTQNLCTGIIPYYQNTENDTLIVGDKIPTGLHLDAVRDVAIDFTNDCNPDSAVPMSSQLAILGNRYISNNILTRAISTITLDFIQLSTLEERVDLCDTVHIYFEALGIATTLKCIKTTWDVLEGRYTSTTFGDPKTNIADTLADQQEKLFESDNKITGLGQAIVDNDVTFYDYANEDAITFGSEVETTVASLAFIAQKATTVKILHEFIMDMTADLAKDGSYEIKYYLDDELVDYSPEERIGAIAQLTEGDLTDVSITRDFYYVVKDVTPNVRHVWKVNVLAHNIANVTIDENHAHVTLEGQRLFSESYFDGYIDAVDYLTIVPLGSLALVSITDTASASVTVEGTLVKHTASDNLTLYDLGGLSLLPIAEGTGLDAPTITMENIFPWATEDGDLWALEDGDIWATE